MCSLRRTLLAGNTGTIDPSALQGAMVRAEKLNSMDLLEYMAPVAVVLLGAEALMMGRRARWRRPSLGGPDRVDLDRQLLAGLQVNLTNFLVTKHTSPLTLQVRPASHGLRNAKGAVAVVVSITIFKNSVTVMGMLGYGVTIAGVVLYGEAKKRSK
ncbi:hypothetical protein ZWY2020_051254 [Hordeum vulgare]|nr:hypothetical protein ZWY2020_051254 [Hordeum vulgare]